MKTRKNRLIGLTIGDLSIARFSPLGGAAPTIATVAGNATQAYTGDGGPATGEAFGPGKEDLPCATR